MHPLGKKGEGPESPKGRLNDQKQWQGANKNKYSSMRVLPIPFWAYSCLLSQKGTKTVVMPTPNPTPIFTRHRLAKAQPYLFSDQACFI